LTPLAANGGMDIIFHTTVGGWIVAWWLANKTAAVVGQASGSCYN